MAHEEDELLARFSRLYDAVIRELRIVYSEASVGAILLLDARDANAGSAWIKLQVELDNIREYAVRDPARLAINVLSDGLYAQRFDGALFLDFAPFTVEPKTIEDYRRSHLYFSCERVRWSIKPC
jgi:hypothetical protein